MLFLGYLTEDMHLKRGGGVWRWIFSPKHSQEYASSFREK
jgi:hypothetical protein